MLVIDIGNTTVALGIWKGKVLFKKIILPSKKEEDFYLRHMMSLKRNFPEISLLVISSVVPFLNQVFKKVVERVFNIKPVILKWKDIDIKVLTQSPQKVGIDRLVNAYGAYKLYTPPAIVIDFGTATTFDVVTEKGEYQGGVIAPGVDISRKALFEKAEQLFPVKLIRPKGTVGKTTKQALQIGIYYSIIGGINEIVNRIKREVGQCEVIATGGYCELIRSKVIDKVDRDLIFKGLYLIGKKIRNKKNFQKNKKKLNIS